MNPRTTAGHVILIGDLMGMEAARFKIVQEEAQMVWVKVLSKELTHPDVLEPLAIHLMILEIIEGDGTRDLISVPFSHEPDERLDQVRSAWGVSSARTTVPAGVIFIGLNDLGPSDGVCIVAPYAVAEILDDDVQELADWLSERASKIASGVLRALGIIPKEGLDIIIENRNEWRDV